MRAAFMAKWSNVLTLIAPYDYEHILLFLYIVHVITSEICLIRSLFDDFFALEGVLCRQCCHIRGHTAGA